MVFMDVPGAFNNIYHLRLSDNLRKRGIPQNIIRWIESFLQDRVILNGTQSASFTTPAGIPQGSPLSPILYMFYDADLLDIPHPKYFAFGFRDDIGHGVSGLTAKGEMQ
jgi:hypothetical protein